MRRCLELARQAMAKGDSPVGSLIVRRGRVVAEGAEAVQSHGDVTAHAEMLALRRACSELGTRDLSGCVLYTTVEPCTMCAYAIRLARIELVVAGTHSADAGWPLSGARVLTDVELLPVRPAATLVRGVLEAECRALLLERERLQPRQPGRRASRSTTTRSVLHTGADMPSRDSFHTVEAIARALPGVEITTTWGAPTLKVRGRTFACMATHKSAEPGTLVVMMDIADRNMLIAEDPATYYLKEHYRNYPCVLVRLSRVHADALQGLLIGAHRYISAKGSARTSRESGTGKRKVARAARKV